MADRVRPAGHSWVYFVQAGEGGPVKIGVTGGELAHRIAQLQTGSAAAILVLAAHAVPSADVYIHEREIHEVFARFRLRGEWFSPEPELIKFVEMLREFGRLPHALQTAILLLQLRDPVTSLVSQFLEIPMDALHVDAVVT